MMIGMKRMCMALVQLMNLMEKTEINYSSQPTAYGGS